MTALVDTCIIIDAMQQREPFWQAAAEVLRLAALEQCECYLTAKSLTDIYYLMHRVTHSDTDTRLALHKLTELFLVADAAGDDAVKAIFSETKDYEDAVMIETAKRIGADCIVTRNIKDYKGAAVKVCTPQELVEMVREA